MHAAMLQLPTCIKTVILPCQVSELFGGLGICSLEAVVGRDGTEYIIEVNDSATALLGESQEEDRKNIAELVLNQMEVSLFVLLPTPKHKSRNELWVVVCTILPFAQSEIRMEFIKKTFSLTQVILYYTF